jgi:predicted phosphodiesterase
MRYLILSDIHANWEALQAVLESCSGRYDKIVCLGDMVGYGADPNAVTEWVRDHVQDVIRGNHDKACCGLEDTITFNPVARRAAEWTMEELTPENRQFLRQLKQGPLETNGFVIVHGSILDEDEYLIDPYDALFQFPHIEGRLVFFGHTHVQGGFLLWDVGTPPQRAANKSRGEVLRIVKGTTQLINPGSVGQPRDFVWQAGYVIYDSDQKLVEFQRCAYDLATAQKKIRDAGLPPALADRLALGR